MSILKVDTIENAAGTSGPDFPFGFSTSGTGVASVVIGSDTISNLGIAVSVAGSAMTVAIKQADGATDPSTGTGAVKVGMRSSTLTSGSFNARSVTAPLSLVVPSGATLGTVSATQAGLYVYLLDNAGTLELAISYSFFNENSLMTTTAISAGSNSNSTAYSTTARTNVPFRLVSTFYGTQTTAGTWAAAPVNTQVPPFPTRTPPVPFITAGSGTYLTPAGVRWLRVRLSGGGGGGGGAIAGTGGTGVSGGASSFGALLAVSGGTGGGSDVSGGVGGTVTTLAAPAIQILAFTGGRGAGSNSSLGNNVSGGQGGANPLSGAGAGAFGANTGFSADTGSGGGGGGGGAGTSGVQSGSGGGAGGYIEAIILSPNATYNWVVGAGGAGGTGSGSVNGGPGGDGILIVEAFYS